MSRVLSYSQHLSEDLQDAEEAIAYLDAALADDDPALFVMALRDVVEARGGLKWLAGQTDLSVRSLGAILGRRGNPTLFHLRLILHAMGLCLSVQLSA